MVLQGKVALVTGSTSGIGLAIAKALAAEGAKLMINGFGDPSDIERECNELGAIHDGADMSKPAEIERMMKRCADELGGPDILVNNAGIQHVSSVEDFPTETWDAIVAINLSSAFHTTRLAVPGMKQKKWGRVINTASAHSLVASPNKSAYVAAKHGIAGSPRRSRWRPRVTGSPSTASRPAMSGPRSSRSRSPTR
jgi:3-hydroxybutyrate dehydrogenase